MKITVAKRELEAALSLVSASLHNSGSGLDAHFVFRLTGREEGPPLEILTHMNRVCSSCPLSVQVDSADHGAFTVEGWRLKKWLQHLPETAIEFHYDGKTVTAVEPHGKNEFQSLNPENFPFWDTPFAQAKERASVPGDRLHRVFSYLKSFVSEEGIGNPGLLTTEYRNGVFQATNMVSIAVVRVEDLKGSTVRIHGRDLPPLLGFLASAGEEQVVVLEHSRYVFFKRQDGAVFAATRFMAEFPELSVPGEDYEDDHWWVLPKTELLSRIHTLSSSASREDNSVWLCPDDQKVRVSIMGTNGKFQHRWLECPDMGSKEDAKPLPKDGFSVGLKSLLGILSSFESEEVRFGISSGFVRFFEERGGDGYLTCTAWLSQ